MSDTFTIDDYFHWKYNVGFTCVWIMKADRMDKTRCLNLLSDTKPLRVHVSGIYSAEWTMLSDTNIVVLSDKIDRLYKPFDRYRLLLSLVF